MSLGRVFAPASGVLYFFTILDPFCWSAEMEGIPFAATFFNPGTCIAVISIPEVVMIDTAGLLSETSGDKKWLEYRALGKRCP